MLSQEYIELFREYISPVQRILIFFPAEASFDQVASATALYLGLQSLEKDVSLLSPVPVQARLASLVGVQNTSMQLGNKNLQISFDYQEDMVDKVSYHIDEERQKFNLVIQPKRNGSPLDARTVEFTYTGAEADLLIFIGVNDLESLDQLYEGYEDFYANTSSITMHSYAPTFGTLKLDVSGSPSFSESMARLLETLGVAPDPDIASNLLAGIEDATDSFRSFAVTADTFETTSKLLRAGGRRPSRQRAASPASTGFVEAFARAAKGPKIEEGERVASQPAVEPETQLPEQLPAEIQSESFPEPRQLERQFQQNKPQQNQNQQHQQGGPQSQGGQQHRHHKQGKKHDQRRDGRDNRDSRDNRDPRNTQQQNQNQQPKGTLQYTPPSEGGRA